jgi:uncharacterized membrane protein YkgB
MKSNTAHHQPFTKHTTVSFLFPTTMNRSHRSLHNAAFAITIIGTAIVLFWIGLFKFTPTEAKAIQPLVNTSPFMSWMTPALGIQTTSNLIGTIEIITALLLVSVFIPQQMFRKLALVGGAMGALTFLLTLSFFATTPGLFSVVDGFLIPDSFILKDIVLFGASLLCVAEARSLLLAEAENERLSPNSVAHTPTAETVAYQHIR